MSVTATDVHFGCPRCAHIETHSLDEVEADGWALRFCPRRHGALLIVEPDPPAELVPSLLLLVALLAVAAIVLLVVVP